MNKTAEQMMEEFELALDKHSKETLMLELIEALNSIEFLHKYLLKNAEYKYPDMIINEMSRIKKIIPERRGCGCIHSHFDKNCENCKFI